MNLKNFLKKTFGKDLFTHLKSDEIEEERVRAEQEIERISDEIKGIQDKIRTLMLESKGQPNTMKLLNVSKIKALRLESNAKQQEAEDHLKHVQLLLLVEAMKEHQKIEEHSDMVEKILDSDIDSLNELLLDTDVKKAMEEGKMDTVKEKLSRVFAKEEVPMDSESQDILKAIDDLERVDEETALRMAGERAREMAQVPLKKKQAEYEKS
jgi:uncharacterized protein (UPF0335 family)